MNTIERLAITCACFVLLGLHVVHADGWRTIWPLHSNAEAVTLMIGMSNYQTGQQPDYSGHGSMKVDEYGPLTTKEEHRRLDNFATELRARPTTQGYIIAYAGRRARPNEAKNRARVAKGYLVKQQGIKSVRIVTVDGGYREEPGAELFLRFENGDPPPAFPTVDPSKVEIIKARPPSKHRHSSKMRANLAGTD
jgi:hypothetical protein